MGEVEQALTISDLRQHAPDVLDRQQVLAAAQHPSVPAFRRALEELDSANADRFGRLVDVSREQSAGSGESDLRRLKRQFSALKNTFLHYDVKEAFIDALSEGCPDGGEAARLAEYEAEVQQFGEVTKQHKADNEKARADVEAQVQRVAAAFAAYERDRDGVLAELGALEAELAAPRAGALDPLPALDPGPDEEECRQLLAEETQRTRDLEAQIAATEAAAVELATLTTCERNEAATQQARLERLQCAKGRAQKQAQAATRFARAEEWAEAQAAAMAELGGVMVAAVNEDALLLRLTTAEVTTDAGVASADHLLTLTFQPGMTRLATAALVPDSADISDAVCEFRKAQNEADADLPLSLLVQDVQKRIAETLKIQAAVAKRIV